MKRFPLGIFLIISFLTCFSARESFAEKLMSDGKILCGYVNGKKGGDKRYCDILGGEVCVECVENVDDSILADIGSIVSRRKVKVYHCQPETQSLGKKCHYAMNGGLKGDRFNAYLFGAFKGKDKEGQNCIVYNYFLKYSNCYGCVVVETLISAFVNAASKAYEVSKQLGNTIILVGMMIWIAFFILKNVSSLSAVDPMQMLQQLLVQIFKALLAMIILNSGMQTILHYTLVPIITTGTDFADTITANVDSVISTDGVDMGKEYVDYWKSITTEPDEGGESFSGGGTGGGSR